MRPRSYTVLYVDGSLVRFALYGISGSYWPFPAGLDLSKAGVRKRTLSFSMVFPLN